MLYIIKYEKEWTVFINLKWITRPRLRLKHEHQQRFFLAHPPLSPPLSLPLPLPLPFPVLNAAFWCVELTLDLYLKIIDQFMAAD